MLLRALTRQEVCVVGAVCIASGKAGRGESVSLDDPAVASAIQALAAADPVPCPVGGEVHDTLLGPQILQRVVPGCKRTMRTMQCLPHAGRWWTGQLRREGAFFGRHNPHEAAMQQEHKAKYKWRHALGVEGQGLALFMAATRWEFTRFAFGTHVWLQRVRVGCRAGQVRPVCAADILLVLRPTPQLLSPHTMPAAVDAHNAS
jgi:hypothetical protein